MEVGSAGGGNLMDTCTFWRYALRASGHVGFSSTTIPAGRLGKSIYRPRDWKTESCLGYSQRCAHVQRKEGDGSWLPVGLEVSKPTDTAFISNQTGPWKLYPSYVLGSEYFSVLENSATPKPRSHNQSTLFSITVPFDDGS